METLQEQKKDRGEHEYERSDFENAPLPGKHKERRNERA